MALLITLFVIGMSCKKNVKIEKYVYDGVYHFDVNDTANKKKHTFVNDVCTECGLYYNKRFFEIFGEEAVLYNSNNNPYDIDIEKYGSSVNVYFYTPDFNSYEDKYENIDKEDFYNDNYDISLSYEDSIYRSKHGLISGKKEPLSYLIDTKPLKENDKEIRLNDATYVLDTKGNFIGYFTNSLDNESRPIWYGGGYVTHDDVSAYLLAFGEVPANSDYVPSRKEDRWESVDKWGVYGRLNKSYYKNDVKRYKYEPKLPDGGYIETDFGSDGGYYTGDVEQVPYIKGNRIIRGACRFVFTDISYASKIEDRYVFYTSNHYNDFCEYLNYDGGYGKTFGNESAGNPYCKNPSEFLLIYNSPTKYPITISKNIKNVFN